MTSEVEEGRGCCYKYWCTESISEDDDKAMGLKQETFAMAMHSFTEANAPYVEGQLLQVKKMIAMVLVLEKKRRRYQREFFKNRNRWFFYTFLLLVCTASTSVVSVGLTEGKLKNIVVAFLAAFSTLLTGVIAALKYDSRKDSFESAAKNLGSFIVELDAFIMMYWRTSDDDTSVVPEDMNNEFDALNTRYKEIAGEIRFETSIVSVPKSKFPYNDFLF